MNLLPHKFRKETVEDMKLKELWNNLFIGEQIESNGMSGGYRRPPLIKKYARQLKKLWLKYWQPVVIPLGIIVTILAFLRSC